MPQKPRRSASARRPPQKKSDKPPKKKAKRKKDDDPSDDRSGGSDHYDYDDYDDGQQPQSATPGDTRRKRHRQPEERSPKRRRLNPEPSPRQAPSPQPRRTSSRRPNGGSGRRSALPATEAAAVEQATAGDVHFPTRQAYKHWRANASGVAANREVSATRMVAGLEDEIAAFRERKKHKPGSGSGSGGNQSQGSANPLPPKMPKGGQTIKTVLGYTMTEEDVDDQLELDDNGLVWVPCLPAEEVAIQNRLCVPAGGKGLCFGCTTGGPSVDEHRMATIARMWEDGAPFTDLAELAEQIATYYEKAVRQPANQVIRSKEVWRKHEQQLPTAVAAAAAAAAVTSRSDSPEDLTLLGPRADKGLAAAAAAVSSGVSGGSGVEREEELAEWTAASIYEHFTEHVDDPELFVGHTIRRLKVIGNHLYRRGIFNFNSRRPSEVRIKAKQLQMYLNVVEKTFKAYQQDTRSLALYRPGRSATSTRNGPRINPSRPRHAMPGGGGAAEKLLLEYLHRPNSGGGGGAAGS